MPIAFSALDLVPLGQGRTSADALAASRELARALERLGYCRLWYAEHHNMPGIATTTPEILIAHIAQHTERIRLGAGGVMLPNHAPLKVAESYRLLEALHPGRIDLGIGRAPGTDPVTAVALRRTRNTGADEFPSQLEELRALASGELPPGHPFARIVAMPDDVTLPPIWLLGSSDYSARLAGELGLGFAFAGHFAPESPEYPLQLYRERFRPGALNEPHAILALAVFCADTQADAERIASSALVSFAELRAGRPGRLPSPEEAARHRFSEQDWAGVEFLRRTRILGTPARVRDEIERLVASTQADEVMIVTHAYEISARVRSYELVAHEFGLAPAAQ